MMESKKPISNLTKSQTLNIKTKNSTIQNITTIWSKLMYLDCTAKEITHPHNLILEAF